MSDALNKLRELLDGDAPGLRKVVGDAMDEIERATFDWCCNGATGDRNIRYEEARAFIRELQGVDDL